MQPQKLMLSTKPAEILVRDGNDDRSRNSYCLLVYKVAVLYRVIRKLCRDLAFQLIMKLSMKIQLKFFQGLAEQDSFSVFQDERFKELYGQA